MNDPAILSYGEAPPRLAPFGGAGAAQESPQGEWWTGTQPQSQTINTNDNTNDNDNNLKTHLSPRVHNHRPKIIYTREQLLELRIYPHVSESSNGSGGAGVGGKQGREGEVLPHGMPQRGEGIGLLCLWDPDSEHHHHRRPGSMGAMGGNNTYVKPRVGGFTRYSSFGRGGEGDADAEEIKAGGKKLETSPTNRFYGLPVDAPPNSLSDAPQRRAAVGSGTSGAGAGTWARQPRGPDDGVGEEVGGGQMGRFQITSRTGLGLAGRARGEHVVAEEGGLAGGRARRVPASGGETTTAARPVGRFDRDADWRRGKSVAERGRHTGGAPATAGAERRYATTGEKRVHGGGRWDRPAEEERTPEWMMDDDFSTSAAAVRPEGSPLGLDEDANIGLHSPAVAGFAKFAGGEGRDEIALYREAMKAKDRRLQGLPTEEVKAGEKPPGLDVHEVSFLLPTAKRTQPATASDIVVAEPPHHPLPAGSRASRFTKHFDGDKAAQAGAPTNEIGNDRTALLAGLLGIQSVASPATASALPMKHAVSSAPPPTLGMPMFFSAPPPAGMPSPHGQPSAPMMAPGKSDDHMSRLLGMLKTNSAQGSPATTPAPVHAFMSPPVPAQRPNSPPPGSAPASGLVTSGSAGGLATSGSVGRESRFFGRHSNAPSVIQSPVESPNQPKHRLAGEPRMERDDQRVSPGHQAATIEQRARDVLPPGLISSAPDHSTQPMLPPGMFPLGPGINAPPYQPGQPMPPPGMERRPAPTSPLEDTTQGRPGMFPHAAGPGMPPPFWQGPPPPLPFGMMQMPPPGQIPPPGYMQGFPPPPPGGMPPGGQGQGIMMSPLHPHMSPAFGPMYPAAAGGPYAMPPPPLGQMQPFPGGGQRPPLAGYAHPLHAAMPLAPQHPQQQQLTQDLMSILGSMQGKTG